MHHINFEKLTKRAIAIFSQERTALLSGNSAALEEARQLKSVLLNDLDEAEKAVSSKQPPQTAAQSQAQLTSLHTIIQRRSNENNSLAKTAQVH